MGFVVGVTIAATACSDSPTEPQVLRVVAGSGTIQDVVDRARPGDLVLIEAGTYFESVEITTADVVVRGADRNAVVIEGRYELENGITVRSDGVAIENLTVRGFAANGVLFVGELDQRGATGDDYDAAADNRQLRGYRVSFVTANDNGLYGLYAFAAQGGVFEDSYVAGHPDAGVYIGQCKPCDAVVRRVVGERNAVGYQAINASGVTVVDSIWRGNRVGMEIGSQDVERLAPQIGHTVVGNLVVDNDDPDTPGSPTLGFGVGIVITGGQEDVVERNRIEGHVAAGVVVTDAEGFTPARNVVRGNVLADNAVDLHHGLTDRAGDGDAASNCFDDNDATSAEPASLLDAGCSGSTEVSGPIGGPAPPPSAQLAVRDVPLGDQRPGPVTDAGVPTARTSPKVDVAAITVPSR
jgi:Right handed beta helix region